MLFGVIMNFQSIIHEIQQLYPTSITQANTNHSSVNSEAESEASEAGLSAETRINNLIKIVTYIQNIELNYSFDKFDSCYTTASASPHAKDNAINISHANIQHPSHRVTLSAKKITEITGCNDKQTFIDVLFYLCGTQWHLLDPFYIYSYDDLDKKEHYFIELSEEDIAQSQLTGFLHHKTLSNENPIPFQLERTYIYLQLSEQAKQLIQSESMNYIQHN